MKDMKVLFIVPSMGRGGAERAMLTLYRHAPFREKTLLSVGSRNDFMNETTGDEHIVFLRRDKMSLALPFLWRYIRRYKPHIIISTIAHTNFAVLLLKPFLPHHIKFVVREATLPSALVASSWKGVIAKHLYRYLYPHAHCVLAPSRRILDDFNEKLGVELKNAAVLNNAADEMQLRALAGKAMPASPSGAIRFVCAGRLNYAKGYDRLIEALAHASLPHDWALDIYGDGPERAKIETLIERHNLQGRIVLKGMSVNPWGPIAAADCLLLPSRWEGMPNVVLESLAVGTPVIAMAEAGGIGEIAAQAEGNVVLADTIDDFVGAMRRVERDNHPFPRVSLLPPSFAQTQVIQEFTSLLRKL